MRKLLLTFGLLLTIINICAAQKTANNPASAGTLSAGTTLEAELQKTVDVKKSNVGDEVVLKVTKSIKQNGEVVVPKGSRLIGRVTEVQQRSKGNQTSKLGVVFDRLEGKNLNTPISATIASIFQTGSSADTGSDLFGSSSSAGASGSGRASAGAGGGGLLGGVGNTVGGVTNTASNTLGGVTNTIGGIANSTVNTAGNTTQTLGGALKGVQLSNSASGSANSSTILSSGNQNIKLEKGLTFQMLVSSSAQN